MPYIGEVLAKMFLHPAAKSGVAQFAKGISAFRAIISHVNDECIVQFAGLTQPIHHASNMSIL